MIKKWKLHAEQNPQIIADESFSWRNYLEIHCTGLHIHRKAVRIQSISPEKHGTFVYFILLINSIYTAHPLNLGWPIWALKCFGLTWKQKLHLHIQSHNIFLE